jgi:hypothetical protein
LHGRGWRLPQRPTLIEVLLEVAVVTFLSKGGVKG